MTFEIEVNGRVRSVSIARAGNDGRFRVSVDGEPTLVGSAQRRLHLSMLFPDDRRAACRSRPDRRGELLAYLAGRSAAVAVNSRRTGRGGDTAGQAHGAQQVSAPMPGRVVRVLVAPGDAVEARQPVVVVEAMKMENELRSPKAGRVKDVTVTAGTSVEAGRVLVVID